MTVPEDPDLDRLKRNLADARRWFRDIGEREGMIRMSIGIDQYLRRANVDVDDLRPLHALLSAIDEAGKGISSPLLEAKRDRSGRPPKAGTAARKEAMAAVVVSLLIDANHTLEAAAKEVSKALGGELTAAQIVTARKNISRSPEHIIEFYQGLLRDLRELPLADGSMPTPDARAAKALKDLRRARREKKV